MRRSWFGTVVKQNKSPSLELLKSLYSVLVKNSIVTDQNKTLIVEVLRSIAETVIWGDQNDPRVFDFFLEKGIQSYFLSIIEQPKCGTYVCTQLLQTLNILFENIRNETSIYFLLSNNHVNSIICHEFDFSDEEIMAYYISFLKTLSLKLNSNTIHFFYNEHLRDFPLYTEAIKFFNHSESMVRIAVRTLTLNVYKVGDDAIVKFIHDKTAAPYFSNLVWFIGNNVLMMERCLRTEANHLTRNKLESLVALHLDDMHYVHDILLLQMKTLNGMLCEHLLNTLLIPLYVYSLDPSLKVDSPQVSVKCALFLLSQVFIILNHPPLVKQLKLYICFEENPNLESSEKVRRFTKPISQIQDTFKPAVIPKNKQNLQPTRLAKEHKEELKVRETKRMQEEARLKDQEKYQKNQTFSQTGYLKSILEPDPGTDPLSGTRVRRVDSLKHDKRNTSGGDGDLRIRTNSTVSRNSSVYSDNNTYTPGEESGSSFIDPLDVMSSLASKTSEAEEKRSLDSPKREQDRVTTREEKTLENREPSDLCETFESNESLDTRNTIETHVRNENSEGFSTPEPEDARDDVLNEQNPEYPVSEDSGIVSSETMENIAQDIDEDDDQATAEELRAVSRDQSPRPSSPARESDSNKTLSVSTENSSFDTSEQVAGGGDDMMVPSSTILLDGCTDSQPETLSPSPDFLSPEPQSPTQLDTDLVSIVGEKCDGVFEGGNNVTSQSVSNTNHPDIMQTVSPIIDLSSSTFRPESLPPHQHITNNAAQMSTGETSPVSLVSAVGSPPETSINLSDIEVDEVERTKPCAEVSIPPIAATSNPGTSNPATSNPATSNPATSNPATSNPATSNPATSNPATSYPASSNPATLHIATPSPDITSSSTTTTVGLDDVLSTPDAASHFADAFHCPPTRSCIFYDALLSCLEIGEDDSEAVFSAALLYSMFTNVAMPHRPPAPYFYDDRIVDRLLNILDKSCVIGGIVRLVTVEISVRLLRVLATYEDKLMLQDNHLAVLTAVKENSVRFLRSFYTGEDNTLFVELFDEEYKEFLKRRPTNIAHLMSDECMLLGPVYTPLTGIDFSKRLPCGELEKMRKSLVVFFTVRKLWQEAAGEEEGELPLLNLSLQVSKGDVLNLNNSDLIACAVSTEHDAVKRFLVIDTHQLILVEPDNAPGRLGYGIVQFVAPLQCVDAKPDKDSNRNLLITIEKSGTNTTVFKARFQFEDHIRCFAAKTRLKQGRESLQKLKGFKLSHILDIPDKLAEEPFFGSSRSSISVYKSGPDIGKSSAEKGLHPRQPSDSTAPYSQNITPRTSSGRSSRSSTTSVERHSVTSLPTGVMTSSHSAAAPGMSCEQQHQTSHQIGTPPATPKKSLDKLPAPEVV